MKRHYPIKDVREGATIYFCPVKNVQYIQATDEDVCDQCGTNLDDEAHEVAEQAIVEGERRYRKSVLGEEA